MSHRPRLSREGKIDAYNMAISYLTGEECAYDNDGDYRACRQWLANKIEVECNRWLGRLKNKEIVGEKPTTHKARK